MGLQKIACQNQHAGGVKRALALQGPRSYKTYCTSERLVGGKID